MKGGKTHRIPLSDAALTVLEQARVLRDDSDLIFPSPAKPGNPMSDMTLTKVLRTCGLADRATVHGSDPVSGTGALIPASLEK